MRFLAIDFETANYFPDSACAVGLALVDNNQITKKESYLIRPPSRNFMFTYIHGIEWEDVMDKPTFGELWPEISEYFDGIDFAVAHNSPFDRRVLENCCMKYRKPVPAVEFKCTVQLSRKVLGMRPANLKYVCEQLNIELNHHDALSDTLACAQIMIEVLNALSLEPPRESAKEKF